VVGYGLIISAVAIVVRLVWVFTSAYWLNLFSIRRHKGNGGESTRRTNLPWRNVLIVGWTGTRGVLSLATAMALPLTLDNGSPFPYRHLILFIAFVVIFVTLVVQGLTLPPLIRLLGVKPRNDERKEEMELQLLMADCTLDYINHHLAVDIAPELKEQLTRRQLHAVARFKKGIEDLKNAPDNGDASAILPVHQIVSAQKEIIRFQRQLLLTLHHKGSFGDEAIRKMERELDIEDLRLHVQQEKGPV
jgi:CPA1 family monovalent cation:H+ antiporter